MWNYPLIFKLVFIIVIVYLIYDFITNGRVRRKIGKKVLSIVLITIGILTVAFIIFRPYIYTKYEISKAIKISSLNEYIEDYKCTGFKGATLVLDVNESFGNLSNKEKYDDIKETNSVISSIIYKNFIYGYEKDRFSEFYKDDKVIINLGSDKYEFQNDILTLNGKEIYKFKAPKSDESTYEAIDNEIKNRPLSNDEELDIRVLTEKLVKDNLKNPSSAKFCGYDELHITKGENGTFSATGWVEATNSFGATLRNNFQVAFERINGNMIGTNVQIFEN